MKRVVWIILFILLLSAAAQAQDVVTVTLTGAQLDQAVNRRLAEIDRGTPLGSIETISVDLQPMKVVLFGKLKRPNNEMWTYKISLLSTVSAQQQAWSLDEVEFRDAQHAIKSPRDSASGQATGKVIDVWEHAYGALLANTLNVPPAVLQSLPVTSLTISTGSADAPSGIIAILIGL
jgi:hypothetical protein